MARLARHARVGLALGTGAVAAEAIRSGQIQQAQHALGQPAVDPPRRQPAGGERKGSGPPSPGKPRAVVALVAHRLQLTVQLHMPGIIQRIEWWRSGRGGGISRTVDAEEVGE